MSELRDPDRPSLPDPAGEHGERPRLRDFYADREDDGWDTIPGRNGSLDTEPTADTDDAADGDGIADDTEIAEHSGIVDGDEPDRLEAGLSRLEADHPEVGSVVRGLSDGTGHRLDLTDALHDPRRRDDTLAIIGELAEGRLVPDGDLQRYRDECPGRGPLFTEVPDEVNRNPDGTSRKDAHLARCQAADPARRIGGLPDARQLTAVEEYASRLATQVEPVVMSEVEDLAADLPGVSVSMRTKNADDILDKVRRMSSGSDSRPPREDYHVGDVADAVGARITATDTDQLGRLLDRVCGTLGLGDGGRVLELDNMYAAPKASNPSYRVIPLLVATEAEGIPYTYELQLTTRRASAAADLEHDTIYKPRVETSDAQRDAVRRMMVEAAALDQEETRSPPSDHIHGPAPGQAPDETTRRTP